MAPVPAWLPFLHQNEPSSIALSRYSNQLVERQMRWMETLQEYYYYIVYFLGKFNVFADAL
jgi:hypothetical protein